MRYIIILLIAIILISCSEQKKLSKAVKRDPRGAVAYIVENYPEYFTKDTVVIKDTIRKEVTIKVPEIVHDTISIEIPANAICNFSYKDRNIELQIKEGRLQYKIKERSIKEKVEIPYEAKVPCPPCPTMEIVSQIKENHKENWLTRAYKWWFWFSIMLIVIYVLTKAKR